MSFSKIFRLQADKGVGLRGRTIFDFANMTVEYTQKVDIRSFGQKQSHYKIHNWFSELIVNIHSWVSLEEYEHTMAMNDDTS